MVRGRQRACPRASTYAAKARQGQYSVAWGIEGAFSLIASLPTLIVFLFFQRYFIRGMTVGAVKG